MDVLTDECGGLSVGEVGSDVDGVISAVGEVDFDSVVGGGLLGIRWCGGGDGEGGGGAPLL